MKSIGGGVGLVSALWLGIDCGLGLLSLLHIKGGEGLVNALCLGHWGWRRIFI